MDALWSNYRLSPHAFALEWPQPSALGTGSVLLAMPVVSFSASLDQLQNWIPFRGRASDNGLCEKTNHINSGRTMKYLPLFTLSIFLSAQFVSAEEPIRERIEWADIWVTGADKDDCIRRLDNKAGGGRISQRGC
jgi:hypothetical protein